ncbi:tRNA-splicing endonuclease subunit Sen34 [Heterocephalus glaber]|uniref:tRNA-splicing endonuclease subunit SEN34 n=1 Tax=Heterocephalus glaber TaxID=10181 RepID=G5CBG1_HETGA|nr:tRNA-splicing endonuclease subunit Sen34 [Heterocephalus glaber]
MPPGGERMAEGGAWAVGFPVGRDHRLRDGREPRRPERRVAYNRKGGGVWRMLVVEVANGRSLALASFRRQQEQSFQEQSALAAEAPAEESEIGGGQASGEQEEAVPSSQAASDGAAPLPRSALLVQLATARPRPVKARPLDWRVQSKDWPHAGRPAHELRYSIYRDLWERGFFLSAAGKFGGDFLVYPGDPLRFHAHYIAQCWAPEDPIPLQDLVSAGRLGTSVRKTLLLCSPQPDGKVAYTSLQWASLQ